MKATNQRNQVAASIEVCRSKIRVTKATCLVGCSSAKVAGLGKLRLMPPGRRWILRDEDTTDFTRLSYGNSPSGDQWQKFYIFRVEGVCQVLPESEASGS